MKNLILILALCLPMVATADNVTVSQSPSTFSRYEVSGKNVKGVNIRLKQTITRQDCNRRSISSQITLASGSGEGYYDDYVILAGTMMTEMGCPLEKPITEIIYSKEKFIASFTNENLDGAVQLTILVPSEYELEVTEVK